MGKQVDEAMRELTEEVNRSRYRGPDNKGPMRESYPWPRSLTTMERIAHLALALVVAREKEEQTGIKESKEPRQLTFQEETAIIAANDPHERLW